MLLSYVNYFYFNSVLSLKLLNSISSQHVNDRSTIGNPIILDELYHFQNSYVLVKWRVLARYLMNINNLCLEYAGSFVVPTRLDWLAVPVVSYAPIGSCQPGRMSNNIGMAT